MQNAMTQFRKWPAEPASRHRREKCDRCGLPFEEGFTWPGLGIPLVLCRDCSDDIEESVRSYGEAPGKARERLLKRLRHIGS
jgi:hypothetical protein